MKRVGILINDFRSLKATQTTAMFAHRVARQGHATWMFGLDSLGMNRQGHVSASARKLEQVRKTTADQICDLKTSAPGPLDLTTLDTILIRTNPGRSASAVSHEHALTLLHYLEQGGVSIWNRPQGLFAAGSKLFVSTLPDWTHPETIVSSDPVVLKKFVVSHDGPCVLKPVQGTRGNDVFKLHGASDNLSAILDLLSRKGFIAAQAFVPEAVDGDTRVLVLDGRPLEIEGAAAAVQRVPPRGDFRSNLFIGGTARPGEPHARPQKGD